MQRGIAATKGVLAGVAAFVATSAVIVTFAVSNANPPPAPAITPKPPAAAPAAGSSDQPSNPTSDAGNTGTPVEPSDESAPAPAASDPSDGSQGSTATAPDVRSKLDPSLTALLGRDVPGSLLPLLPPPNENLPKVELVR